MTDFRIAPSILSADFARLGEEVDAVLEAGADLIHFDVMDNHFVPNLTIGPLVCGALRRHGVSADIDVHLMVKPVDRIIPEFAAAGATYITFHPEATEHVDRSLRLVRDHGCKCGLVLTRRRRSACHTCSELTCAPDVGGNASGSAGQLVHPQVLDIGARVRARIGTRRE